jgi:hypothetical protein
MPKPLKKKRINTTGSPTDVNQWARKMVEESTAESESPAAIAPAALSAYMSALGRKGGTVSGKRRMKNLSDQQRQAIALKAARARWGNRRRQKI